MPSGERTPWEALSDADPIMRELIFRYGELLPNGNHMASAGELFTDLARSIVGQQLSGKAASTIWGRVVKSLAGGATPEVFLQTSDEDLRSCGLSAPKTKYIKNIASAVEDGTLELHKMKDMTDGEVVAALTRIKGIGLWTAEMFLIFSLGRPDVFSFGDWGLRTAITRLYGAAAKIEQEAVFERWAPYRSYACLYLWESLDNGYSS